eukprot:4324424-Pyramimonas_sp.AAC.1
MAHPLLLGLSLLRYNRAGAWLRLRQSCWLASPLQTLSPSPPGVNSLSASQRQWLVSGQASGGCAAIRSAG